MTQNTQTTAERIAQVIETGYTQDGFGNFDGFPVAVEIAAEIDALTRERDEARAELVKRSSQLIVRKAELVECEAALTKARAEVVDLKLELVDRNTRLTEARAEVERLRPAAEAWRRMGELHKMGWSAEYSMTQARKLGEEDAARAARGAA